MKSFSHSCKEQANFRFPSCTDSFYNEMSYIEEKQEWASQYTTTKNNFPKTVDGHNQLNKTCWNFIQVYLMPLKSSFMLCAETAISTIDSLLGVNRIMGVSFTGRGSKTKTPPGELECCAGSVFSCQEILHLCHTANT